MSPKPRVLLGSSDGGLSGMGENMELSIVQQALVTVSQQKTLSSEMMYAFMQKVMVGEVEPVHLAGFLMGLRSRGETVVEIAAAVQVMRELVTRVPLVQTMGVVDTCGTGGDGAHTFNISTTAAFVAAAAGAKVAKHGGRSVSSSSGSADVLEALGVHLQLSPAQVAQCVDSVGVGFMFAPNHHSAMKHAAPIRKALGVRTLFNMLGPLTNPAGASCQLIGVFEAALVPVMAQVLLALGCERALVVHGDDGLDEITLYGNTRVAEVRDGQWREYTVCPQDFGFSVPDAGALYAADATTAKAMLLDVLANKAGAPRDIVCLNAGAAIYLAGHAMSLQEGVQCADDAIASGAAQQKLQDLIHFSQTLAGL